MFETRKDLTERITALNARNDELETLLEKATNEATANAQTAADAVASKDAAQAELQTAKEELAATASDLEAAKAENVTLSADLADDSERVAAAAAAEMAKIGHAPVEDSEAGAMTDKQIAEQFAAMKPGKERTAFYKENRDVLAQ
jgi:predicted  nucleic acid-binding Zn-ribbon protein